MTPGGVLPINYDEENNCIGNPCPNERSEFAYHRRALRENGAVAQLRDQLEADLVVTFVGDGEACGVAYAQKFDCGFETLEAGCSVGPQFEPFALAVVSAQPGCEDWTFAHEVGHTFGMEHDPVNGSPAGAGSFLWSYGHFVSNVNVQARDVMAYPTECPNIFGCPVNLQFSNPQRDFMMFPGTPSGTNIPDLKGRTRFNARTATLFSEHMANFRGVAITDRVFRHDFESLPDQ